MIPELGHLALWLALGLALIQAVLPWLGFRYEITAWQLSADRCARGQCVLLLISFLALTYAFATKDFSVVYVANNANSQLPLIYRLCAVWGAHEGSLLLWIVLLSGWGYAVSQSKSQLPQAIRLQVLAVIGAVSVGFLGFILFTSNPFLRYLPRMPIDGRDLNPLLQDPGLISHPPILYMGYVGMAVAFAFAIVALLNRQLNQQWARWVRSWTQLAWAFLTAGIVLGSWWAYRELGWGGWWFWDPVENASFLPWLASTALLHSLIVTERRNVFKVWTVLLAICAFSLSLLGTFLVRSGVLVSVHAFAVDPTRGGYLLGYLGVVIGGSLALFAWRAGEVRERLQVAPVSRESGLLVNNLLLLVSLLTVLLGTLYPLLVQAIGWGKISIGAPYFNQMMGPLGLLLCLAMGVGVRLRWREGQLRLRWLLELGLCAAAAQVLLAICALHWVLSAWLGCSAALWVIWMTGWAMRESHGSQRWTMGLAHLGLAVCVLGISISSAYSVQRQVRLAPGDQVELAGYQLSFQSIAEHPGPNYKAVRAMVVLQPSATVLQPERRVYHASGMALAKVALDRGIFRDLYVAIGEPLDGQAWSFRFYYKPFVRWIWAGGLMMVLAACWGWCLQWRRKDNASL